ncbi:hypothetical protein LTR37_014383 [Vermiconidia calcicola]|uniref:Uncharacterized protein n=1 Tax=Vermiconidia calcicola TaxID=1690605 RepID=A0ACC3MTN5_9PEZI|nr:hypothetical protein LTR37_014383 [Vermiconidia calcicola]
MAESTKRDRRSRRRDDSQSDDVRPRRKSGERGSDGRRSYDIDMDRAERHERHRRKPEEREYRSKQRSRERSRSPERSQLRRRSRSPPPKRRRHSESTSRPSRRSRAPLPSQDASFRGGKEVATTDGPPVEKQKPNYKPTGLLAKEANTVAGTTRVLKYHEPPEARKPPAKERWRMYVFKQENLLDTIYLHQRSAWLMGRDEKVTDYLLEHPSASKQHAVIQFRHRTTTNEFGDKANKVKPYLIDLDSANGTKLNGKKIGASRYVELVDGDVVAFGDSEREYVMMLPPPEGKKADASGED